MSTVIDWFDYRLSPSPTTYRELPRRLRVKVDRAMVGLGLDPNDYRHMEIGEALEVLFAAAGELRDTIATTPGVVCEGDVRA